MAPRARELYAFQASATPPRFTLSTISDVHLTPPHAMRGDVALALFFRSYSTPCLNEDAPRAAGGPPAAAGQAYPANVAPGQAMMAQMGMAQDPAALAANFRAPNGTGMQAMGAMAGNMPMPAGGPPGGLQPGVAAAQAWGSSSGGPYPQPTGGIIQPGKRVRSTGPPKDANGMPLFESKEEKRRRQVKEAAQRYRDKKRNAKKEGGFAEGEDMAKYKRAPQQPMDDVAQPGESKEEKRRRQLNKAAQRYREKKRRARAELPPGGLQPAQPMQVMQGQVVMPLPPGGVHVMPSPPGGLQQATAEQPPSANVLGSTMHTNMEFTPEDPAS